MIGKRFGRWTVTAATASRKSVPYWVCACDCGTVREVNGHNLAKGLTTACGCVRKERAVIQGHKNKRHGHATSSKARSSTYVSWEQLIQRARVQDDGTKLAYSYAHVTVCERWLDFRNFLYDMGQRPTGKSIDRIDNARGYEPANCRWSTQAEQIRNTRPRANRWQSRSNKARRIEDMAWKTA
jgi:hypothetical protein